MTKQQQDSGHIKPVQGLIAPPGQARQRSNSFLVTAIVAFTAFISLLLIVRANPRLERDVRATIRFQATSHPTLKLTMRLVSWFGFQPQSLILPVSAVVGTWMIGLGREARYLAFAWAASLVSYTVKRIVMRPRPSGPEIVVEVANLRDSSFPSGHTIHYVTFWGFFTYLCFTELRGRFTRLVPVTGITSLIALVGPSRVYLGHHWLTDVLASYCLGVGYLAGLIGLHRRHIGEEM